MCPLAKSAPAPARRGLAEPREKLLELRGGSRKIADHPYGALCGRLMGRYHSAAGSGAFSRQIPKYMGFFFPPVFCLLSEVGSCRAAAGGDGFFLLWRCRPHRAARCPCSADASSWVLIPDAQRPIQAAGGWVNVLSGVGTNSPGMPRAARCHGEALPGGTQAVW